MPTCFAIAPRRIRKEKQHPRREARRIRRQHDPRRGLVEHLDTADLSPVARIGRHLERLFAHHLAPDTAREAEAVTAHAAQARLVVVGRAQPEARYGDHARGIGSLHSASPVFEPSRRA
jgi:hypothetical protein